MTPQEIRDKFKAKAARPRQTREVPDLPDLGTVHVRSLSAPEYDRYESACVVSEEGKQVYRGNRALLIRMTVCTPEGQLVFRDEDMEYLSTLPPDVAVPLANAAAEVSGLTKASSETAAKNSATPTGTDSGGS